MNTATWSKRCNVCGEYVSGRGRIPDFADDWMCGFCVVEESWSPSGEHVVVDQRRFGASCHYVVIDLDLDREGI